MSRNSRTDSPRTPAPRSGRIGKSLRLVRVGFGAYLVFSRSPKMGIRNGRSAECISGSAFDNAFRGLKPGGQPVRPSFFPAGRHRRESSLLALGLEAEPPTAVFAGDSRRTAERSSPALGSSPPVETAFVRSATARGCPPVSLPSLSRGRRNQPHLPPFASQIEKRSITHARSSAAVMRQGLCSPPLPCRAGARNPPFCGDFPRFLARKRTYQRVSTFLPASRWSKLSKVLKTRK